MVTIKGQYELADFREAQKLHAQAGNLMSWGGYLIIAMLLIPSLGGILSASRGSMPWSGVIPLILVLTLIAVIRFIVTPRRIARLFKQQKDLSAPFVIELTDETSSSHNEFGEGCLPWGTFVKWEENEKLLLLYRSDVLFHMLPKRL